MKAQPTVSPIALSQPPRQAAAPRPRLSATRVVGAALILSANVGWYLWLERTLGIEKSNAVIHDMSDAEKLMLRSMADLRKSLESRASMIADDARLRAAIPVPGMDEATMSDLLQDIAVGTKSKLVALLGPDGTVRAFAGSEPVQYGSLASTAVFRRAVASPNAVSGLWVLAERPFHVALAPVRFGEQEILAYVLVGQRIPQKRLELIEQITHVSVAIVTGDQALLSSTRDPVRVAEIGRVLHAQPPSTPEVVVKKDPMEEAGTPAPLLELLVSTPTEAPPWHTLLFIPLLTALAGALLLFTGNRR